MSLFYVFLIVFDSEAQYCTREVQKVPFSGDVKVQKLQMHFNVNFRKLFIRHSFVDKSFFSH